MHRPPPRRARRIAALTALTALTALIALAACGGDDAPAAPHVLAIAAQPCASPNRSFGWGVVVDEDVVVTAAHTVEGPLRELRVGGQAATLVALDDRTDLALLTAPGIAGEPAELSDGQVAEATVLTADGERSVEVTSTGPLVVHDTTAGVRHERLVHRISPAAPAGTSGAPLVDDRNRVVGIVVLSEPGDDVAYAVTASELATVLEQRPDPVSPDCG